MIRSQPTRGPSARYAYCVRCGGLTVPELIEGTLQDTWGCRCVLCGARFDPVILANQSPTVGDCRAGAGSRCGDGKVNGSMESGGKPRVPEDG